MSRNRTLDLLIELQRRDRDRRAGIAARARREFDRLGLAGVHDHVEVISLGGRLLKDLAFAATGAERRQYARESAATYAAAYALRRDYYPGINTAAMSLIAGDHAHLHTIPCADFIGDLLQQICRPGHQDQ